MNLTKKGRLCALALSLCISSFSIIQASAASITSSTFTNFNSGSVQKTTADTAEDLDLATGSNARAARTFSLNEVVVTTPQELKAALEDATVDSITFGNDIVMDIATVKIETRRLNPDLVINGNGYSFTEYYVKSYDAGKGLLVSTYATKSTLKNITLKDFQMINGGNGYGTVYVTSAFCGNNAVNLIYDNIRYEGPQITHNIYGSAEYINSEITIDYAKKYDSNGNVTQQGTYVGEVGELGYARLEGTVSITKVHDKGACPDEIFWLHAKSTGIDIAPDANVTVVNQVDNKCAPSAFVYGSKTGTIFNIGEDAVFNYSGYSLFNEGIPFYEINVEEGAEVNIDIVGGLRGLDICKAVVEAKDNLTVGENASLHITATGDAKQAVLEVGKLFTAEPGSTVEIQSLQNAQKVVCYPTVLIGGRATANQTALDINSPDRFFIYNSNDAALCKVDAALGFTKTLQSDITAYSIQYWETSNMDLDPDRNWAQDDDFNVLAKIQCEPLSKVSSVTTTDYNGVITKEEYCFSQMNIILINGESSGQPEQSKAPIINSVSNLDTVVKGNGIADSTIVVTFPDGDEVTTIVLPNGTWTVNTVGGKTYDAGLEITAIQTEPGKLSSDPTVTVVYEEILAPEQSRIPEINPVSNLDTVVNGVGVPGATITVIFPDNDVATTTVRSDGTWTVYTDNGKTYDPYQDIFATQTEPGKTVSEPTFTTIYEEFEISADPIVDPVFDNDLIVTGMGVPGATITVYFPDQTVVVTVDNSGAWAADTNGKTYDASTEIVVFQQEPDKFESNAISVIVDKH